MRKKISACFIVTALCMLGICGCNTYSSKTFIVRSGEPKAEIIISEKPARMTKLAASNLQEYVFKMTGATLPVTSTPSENIPVKIYVGKSKYTDELKLSTEGLAHGAFRMASGTNWPASNASRSDAGWPPSRWTTKMAKKKRGQPFLVAPAI